VGALSEPSLSEPSRAVPSRKDQENILFKMLLRGLATVLSAGLTVIACTNCTNESPEPYTIQPPPWTLKGTVYGAFLLPGLGVPLDNVLPKKAFAPLERQFPYAVAGNYTGKIGMIQVVRYSESPVGPYDEMFIIPGFFEYLRDGEIKEGVRVSRIYVSQKYCVWNSRKGEISCHRRDGSWNLTNPFASSLEPAKTPREVRLYIQPRRQ
jgi:hypothetical protein